VVIRSSEAVWQRAIIHVDMDAFYASVEIRDNPELAGRPLVVGGRPESRGVVAAASYRARTYGIHSAMPMARAVRLCPDLVIVPPRGQRYVEESRALRAIFDSYTPLVEPISLDEAFLDVTGSQRLYGTPPAIGKALQRRIQKERKLSASVGVAACKSVAKVASDLEKPAGFVVVEPGTEEDFLRPLPISRTQGVGPVTERALAKLGIRTIGDLQRFDARTLGSALGSVADHLMELAHGCDDSPVEPHARAKSLSAENTFAHDLVDLEEMERELLRLAERVGQRLRDRGLTCRTVTLKVRYADFRTITRSTTVPENTNSTERLFSAARDMLRRRVPLEGRAVRLLGLGTSHLRQEGAGQLKLFDPAGQGNASLIDHAMDHVRRRLGPDALRRGRLFVDARPNAQGRLHRAAASMTTDDKEDSRDPE